jgi:hypothetical protein
MIAPLVFLNLSGLLSLIFQTQRLCISSSLSLSLSERTGWGVVPEDLKSFFFWLFFAPIKCKKKPRPKIHFIHTQTCCSQHHFSEAICPVFHNVKRANCKMKGKRIFNN